MPQPAVVLFTGLPGTGKTTLSRNVAEALGLVLVAKDAIKEIMFDNIGWSDKAFSAKLARATYEIMDHLAMQHLKTGQSVILEANYSPAMVSEKFKNWHESFNCTVIQIVCRTDIDILAERYAHRSHSGERHPGHLDNRSAQEYCLDFLQRIENGEDQPLEVTGPVRIVDTTNFAAIDLTGIIEWIKTCMA